MFGYATDETEEAMPLTLVLSHKLNARLHALRRNGVLGLGAARLEIAGERTRGGDGEHLAECARTNGVCVMLFHSPYTDAHSSHRDGVKRRKHTCMIWPFGAASP